MLYALFELRHEFGAQLVVAHYDHALRRSSVRDQAFVRKLAAFLGLPLVTERNPLRKKPSGSTEEFARECRYAFFARAARKHKAGTIVLAHTKDDLAETVLMRVLRGTGLSGLRAIRPERAAGTLRIVRPMLNISRREVEAFLRERKAGFVSDPTNRSLKFTRNRIRHSLLPYLERTHAPDIKARLAVLADTVAVDYEFIESEAGKVFDRIVTCRGEKAECPVDRFQRLHPALRRMLLRLIVGEVKGNINAFSLEHITDMDLFIRRGRPGGRMDLPAGLVLLKDRRSFRIAFLKDVSNA